MTTDGTNDDWRLPEGRPIYEIPVTRPDAGHLWPVDLPSDEGDALGQQPIPVGPPVVPIAQPVSAPVQPAYAPAEPALVPAEPARTFPPPTEAVLGVTPTGPALAPPASTPMSEYDTSTLTEEERETLARADAELVASLRSVVAARASDLHITVGAAPMIRVDGALTPAGSTQPWSSERTRQALYSLLDDRQKQQFERELELDFAFTVSANSRFRVNIYQQRGSVGAAFRLIPTEIKNLRDLGVPESVAHLAQLPRGLVLVTGPTGSGKSTTLAALIDLVNSTRADHIVTVEDPIEFMHVHKRSIVNQREVGHDTHSFNNALKHVLRQDPDVILIGELRDLETISVALTAAETGHLVFATLHTQDAPQTIDRVIDVFPPHQQQQIRAQLAATLQGVICQTLVKRASGTGRAVATEVMLTTPAIANLIREGKTYQIGSMMQAGKGSGMHTMDQHLAELVDSGTITRTVALEKAHDPDGLTRLIQRVETPGDSATRAFAASGPDYGDSYSGGTR